MPIWSPICGAPTPSAAAELVAKNRLELERHLDQLELRLATQMKSQLSLLESRLAGLHKRLRPPQEIIRLQQQQLAQQVNRLQLAMQQMINDKTALLSGVAGRLNALSPLAVLSRGYAIVKHEEMGKVITTAADVEIGDELDIMLAHGKLKASVQAKQD